MCIQTITSDWEGRTNSVSCLPPEITASKDVIASAIAALVKQCRKKKSAKRKLADLQPVEWADSFCNMFKKRSKKNMSDDRYSVHPPSVAMVQT